MGEDLLEMEGLVRHEGAQRIDEDAGFALEQGGARSMQMEYERLAAPRCHDGKRIASVREGVERASLRIM